MSQCKTHLRSMGSLRMATPFSEPERQVRGIERLAREAATLLEKREVEYLGIQVRSILNRCSSPRMPFTWTINPYRGCEFGCRYCYARYTHEFMGLARWEDFEEKIYVKRDAARILVRELTPERLSGQSIALGTATDSYQPAERRYGVTQSLLAVMAAARDLRLSISTKSDLVTRDIDLLRRIAARSSVQVNLTVTTLDRRLTRILEFRAHPGVAPQGSAHPAGSRHHRRGDPLPNPSGHHGRPREPRSGDRGRPGSRRDPRFRQRPLPEALGPACLLPIPGAALPAPAETLCGSLRPLRVPGWRLQESNLPDDRRSEAETRLPGWAGV